MTDCFGKDIRPQEGTGPSLTRIFRPISRDLQAAQERLTATLTDVQDPSVREIIDFLLESPGKRIRPALVLLSAGAAGGKSNSSIRGETFFHGRGGGRRDHSHGVARP